MVQNHLIICHLLLFTFFVVQISISATHNCTQSCPGSTLGHVQYPFGFSQSCGICLNCTQGKIRIGEFEVRNVTSDAIEVMVPGKCNRPITDIVPLFGTNYVPSWNNGLLLKNCTVPLKGCQVPKALLESQFELNKCNETPHCFSKEDKQLGEIGKFMSLANINQSNCKVLYSSIAVDADVNVVNMSSSIALQFQIVLAEWWLDGNCSCSSYANCTSFNSSSIGRTGFRCRCLPGYEGDGFHNGIGCRKAATHKCNANKYLSGRCEGMTKFALLIGGIVTGALLVTGLAFLCYFIRRRSISLKSRNITKRLLSETAGDCSVPFYTFKEIERATNSFSEKHRLGTGAYGTVYAGRLHNDEWVAIKKIRYRDREGVKS
ncbi:hypothetical protein GIB67_005387 [Kingdonia uniflora]|uniref:Uncharacterized protein n=1 Tax=Kingdonia uniflora TaxID=39325 RepID=A0A7J7NH67_9MAGN|nr:hypothetical protein GIB67_005387 [Kingdonia uniflora]